MIYVHISVNNVLDKNYNYMYGMIFTIAELVQNYLFGRANWKFCRYSCRPIF